MSKWQRAKYVKMMTAIALTAAAVAPAAAAAGGFRDVPSTHPFFDEITSLSERGIIQGFPGGTFQPEQHLTRGQAAKILAGVLALDTTNVSNPQFKDIPSTHPYYGAIAALKQAGIIDGHEDGTFRQGAVIQRNHVAKILANALNLKAENPNALPFQDVHPSYREAVAALYENRITLGKTAGMFDGSSAVTRGQMAAFIVRAEAVAAPAQQPAQTVIFKVTDYSAEQIAVNGKTYAIAPALKPVFSNENKVALKDAAITATVENGMVTKITQLTLNAAGTAQAKAVFDADVSIDSLTVNADNVTVKNVTVANNAVVTVNVASEVVLDGGTVSGILLIDHAIVGTAASTAPKWADGKEPLNVKLKNTRTGKIQVKRTAVSIETDMAISELTAAATVAAIHLQGAVTKMTAESATKLEVTGNATIGQLALPTSVELLLNMTGTVNELKVLDTAARLTVGTGLTIRELWIPANMSVSQMITNYAAVASKILKINGSTVPSTGTPGTGGGAAPNPNPVTPPVQDVTLLPVKNATELAQAINKAKPGDTIQLTAPVTGNITLTDLVKLDLNGQTLTGNVTIAIPAASGTYSIAPTGGTGTITGDLRIQAPNMNVTVDGLTVEGETIIE